VNQAIVGEMVRCFGIEPSRCATIVSGVDLLAAGEPPLSKSRRQILFFGRMATHKNPQLLVEAFHESGIQREGFHLEMAGGGPELERLRRDSSFSGITYHGLVSEEEKWNLLRQSSLLVMPSRREGFPRVVAEAACVGTPTLALDFPGNGTCSVVRDYSIGRVCAPTREALVEELRAFAKGADYLDMAQHCQSVARTQFSWDTVSDKLVEFLGAKEN
jgi:glycosyltransferase involved in cell wall biosynthesis